MLESDPPARRINRSEGLNLLKGFAIVGVTLFHMFPQDVRGGYLGVSLFFVITGYLLAYTGARRVIAKRFSVIDYYFKRIWRIYPPLLFVLCGTAGAMHLLMPDTPSPSHSEVISILCGFNNWWQIAQSADYFTRITEASPFTHLWFLGIELEYYAAWVLLLALAM